MAGSGTILTLSCCRRPKLAACLITPPPDSCDPVWGTILGRLYRDGKITSALFAAGKRWCELVADYSELLRSPKPPQTVLLDAIGGMSTDPDTESGRREVARHERASAAYLEGRHALRLAGRDAERVVTGRPRDRTY